MEVSYHKWLILSYLEDQLLCHIVILRCVCRRAERLAVHLSHNEPVAEIAIKYLNRLSDYLFVLARLSQDLKAEEVKWIPRK
jgi:cob(I)alamin adenosyltransferase